MLRRLYRPGLALGILMMFVGSVSGVYGQATTPGGPAVITVTPQADGSVVHTVHRGETLAAIAQAYGVSVDQIRQLNGASADAVPLAVGTFLLIRIGESTATLPPNATIMIVTATYTPVIKYVVVTATNTLSPANLTASAQPTTTPSPTQQPTATQPTVTPSPLPTLIPIGGSASLCVTAFNDANTNHWYDSGEALLPGVQLSLTPSSGNARQVTTTADSPSCFDNLAPGQYMVNAQMPDGYGPTTPQQLTVQVQAGQRLTVSFGAAQGYQPPQADSTDSAASPTETPAPRLSARLLDGISRNSGLLVLGIAVLTLVGGLAVIFIARRQ